MLLIVGVGINALAHVSAESQAAIEQADHVYFLLPQAAARAWLREHNANATDLSVYYQPGKERAQTYDEMVNCVMAALHPERDICVVFYGHPGVFVTPAQVMVRQARARGIAAQLLPAISAVDCLYADLNLDPAVAGCQMYEATDFLLRPRRLDTTANLILWQVGVIGHTASPADPIHPVGIQQLTERLQSHYPLTHEAIIYEAATNLLARPRITRLPLAELPEAVLRSSSTLYVPPVETAATMDSKVIVQLEMGRG